MENITKLKVISNTQIKRENVLRVYKRASLHNMNESINEYTSQEMMSVCQRK